MSFSASKSYAIKLTLYKVQGPNSSKRKNCFSSGKDNTQDHSTASENISRHVNKNNNCLNINKCLKRKHILEYGIVDNA